MAKTSGGIRNNYHSNNLRKALKSTEGSIRRNKYESAVVYDTKGRIILKNKGDYKSVSFTDEDIAKMANSIFTHNHPSALGKKGIKAIGNSFSWQDLNIMVKGNVREMRAVTPTYTFTIKRPKNGWGISHNKIEPSFNKIKRSVDKDMIKYLNDRGWSETALARANTLAYHKINKLMAKKYGWEYSKRKG